MIIDYNFFSVKHFEKLDVLSLFGSCEHKVLPRNKSFLEIPSY